MRVVSSSGIYNRLLRKRKKEEEKERGGVEEKRTERASIEKTKRTRGKVISSLPYIAEQELTKSKGSLRLLTAKRGRLSLGFFRGRKARAFPSACTSSSAFKQMESSSICQLLLLGYIQTRLYLFVFTLMTLYLPK